MNAKEAVYAQIERDKKSQDSRMRIDNLVEWLNSYKSQVTASTCRSGDFYLIRAYDSKRQIEVFNDRIDPTNKSEVQDIISKLQSLVDMVRALAMTKRLSFQD